jgi:hypothetical protein
MSLSFVIAILSLPAASLAQPDSGGRFSQEEAALASEALTKWLEQDCEEGDLKSLIQFRQLTVPGLIAALNEGPPPATRELVRRLANESYDELLEQAQRKPERRIASGRDAYVARDVDNLDAQYRVRAAVALAVIGGPDARNALENALRRMTREDIEMAIRELLERKR